MHSAAVLNPETPRAAEEAMRTTLFVYIYPPKGVPLPFAVSRVVLVPHSCACFADARHYFLAPWIRRITGESNPFKKHLTLKGPLRSGDDWFKLFSFIITQFWQDETHMTSSSHQHAVRLFVVARQLIRQFVGSCPRAMEHSLLLSECCCSGAELI